MPRRVRVFLPRWMRWLAVLVLAPMWAVVTWQTFGPGSGPRLAPVEWVFLSAVFAIALLVVVLSSLRRLPLYEAEIEDDDRDPGR